MQSWAVHKAGNPVLHRLVGFLGLPMMTGWVVVGIKIGHPDTIGILCVLNVLEIPAEIGTHNLEVVCLWLLFCLCAEAKRHLIKLSQAPSCYVLPKHNLRSNMAYQMAIATTLKV